MSGDGAPHPASAWRIVQLDEIDSTQEEAKRRLRAGEPLDATVLRAARQRAGRGRRGRSFVSEVGGSYQSLVVRDAEGAWRHGAITLALAVGIAEALAARGAQVGLKWPNDLIDPAGRKCGGLLAEHVHGHLITGVGVGVDVATAPAGFGVVRAPLDAVHAAVMDGVTRGLALADTPVRLPGMFAPWDVLAGRTVSVTPAAAGAGPATGVAEGVTAGGALRLRSPRGDVRTVPGGSVIAVDPSLT
ncbi:MAG: biotin--[acetyl-CoA-carboxylase] ligase [Trueperaceae bacterium]|nr:biotin--[acetyl-CoA-carboxylase] ligase [Trueperaceae bacterium]